jgi:hypothetical protein
VRRRNREGSAHRAFNESPTLTDHLTHSPKGNIMNKFNTIVFAALTVLGSAQAMAAGVESFNRVQLVTHVSPSSLTRAEVQAEYQRAVASGELHDLSLNRFTSPAEHRAETNLTRAEVQTDYQRTVASGEVHDLSINRFTFPVERHAESKLTRADVKAEYIRARNAGELNAVDFDSASLLQQQNM